MSNSAFTISLTVILTTMGLVAAIAMRPEPIVTQTNLEKLPFEVGNFIGTDDSFSDAVNRELNADKQIYRHYWSKDGKQVDLYIGYYGTAKGGRTSHNPYGCLSGGGWGTKESHITELRPEKYKESVAVNYVLSSKGLVNDVMFYWYQADRSKVLPTGIQQNIHRFQGKIFWNRNDGAFVRVSMRSNSAGIDEAKLVTKDFAEKILDLLPEYWPVEN